MDVQELSKPVDTAEQLSLYLTALAVAGSLAATGAPSLCARAAGHRTQVLVEGPPLHG